MRRYLEAGRLNSPRGLRGELRFECWCDSLEFLEGTKRLYLDSEGKKPIKVKEYIPHLSTIIFEGYEDRGAASVLTGRTLYFDREDIELPEGVCFNDDLIGLPVFLEDGSAVGTLKRIDEGAASELYTVEGEVSYLIPAVGEYIVSKNPEKGIIVRNIDGLEA